MLDRLCVLENLIEQREAGPPSEDIANAAIDFYSKISVVGDSAEPNAKPSFGQDADRDSAELPSLDDLNIQSQGVDIAKELEKLGVLDIVKKV